MTEIISAEAQALIDRLAVMDLASPRLERAVIERVLRDTQRELGLAVKPVTWMDDPLTGYEFVVDRACADKTAVFSPIWLSIPGGSRFIGLRGALVPIPPSAQRDVDAISSIGQTWFNTWTAERVLDRYTDAYGACMLSAPDWADEYAVAAIALANGVEGIEGQDRETAAVLNQISFPMFDAFEAGLLMFWRTERDVVCVPRPAAFIVEGRPHRPDGPALIWASGRRDYCWRGVAVHRWIIEEPHKITVEAIRTEPNQEIRRCMTEIYGLRRYLHDAGARLVHEDEFGRLWEAPVGDQIWRIVEVENGTPEPDGTRRTYTLDVTGAAEVLGWPIETARAAVAATYGLRPEEYSPEVRT